MLVCPCSFNRFACVLISTSLSWYHSAVMADWQRTRVSKNVREWIETIFQPCSNFIMHCNISTCLHGIWKINLTWNKNLTALASTFNEYILAHDYIIYENRFFDSAAVCRSTRFHDSVHKSTGTYHTFPMIASYMYRNTCTYRVKI